LRAQSPPRRRQKKRPLLRRQRKRNPSLKSPDQNSTMLRKTDAHQDLAVQSSQIFLVSSI